MQVILIFTYDVSLKDWKENGLLKREVAIYKELAQNFDIKFTFLTYGTKLDEDLIDHKNISVIPIYKLINKSKLKYLNYFKTLIIPFKLKGQLKNIDIIKTNQLNGSWLGIIFKFLLDAPLFIRTGYNIYEFKKMQERPLFITLFYKYLTKLSYFYCDIFTVTSSVDKENISLLCKDNFKLKIVKNYVSNLKIDIDHNKDGNKLFSVGRLEPQKNYNSLIKILKNSNYHFDIVGKGSLKNKLLNTAKENNVKLNLIEGLDHKELLGLYPKYKYFILNSKYEGNPKVVLEALASGCIVICRDNLNIREIIINNINGFIYSDESEILSIINKLNSDDNLYKRIVSEGLKTIKENHLLEVIAKQEIEIYKNITY